MSQQVKIPLQGALGDSQALLKCAPPEEESSCRALDESTRRVWHVVKDIVDVSKMENGLFHLESDPLDLALILDSVVLDCRMNARKRKVTVDLITNDELMPVLGDLRHLTRLLGVLVRDAISSAKSRVSVSMSTGDLQSEASQWSAMVELCVRYDSGQDIEQSEMIFGMREVEDELGVHAETGLGIAMAASICEFMGGSLEFCRRPDSKDGETRACMRMVLDTARYSGELKAAA